MAAVTKRSIDWDNTGYYSAEGLGAQDWRHSSRALGGWTSLLLHELHYFYIDICLDSRDTETLNCNPALQSHWLWLTDGPTVVAATGALHPLIACPTWPLEMEEGF